MWVTTPIRLSYRHNEQKTSNRKFRLIAIKAVYKFEARSIDWKIKRSFEWFDKSDEHNLEILSTFKSVFFEKDSQVKPERICTMVATCTLQSVQVVQYNLWKERFKFDSLVSHARWQEFHLKLINLETSLFRSYFPVFQLISLLSCQQTTATRRSTERNATNWKNFQ